MFYLELNMASNVQVYQGYLKAATNLSLYSSGGGWIEFGWLEGLTLTGGGTFDGQGAKAWPFNSCGTHLSCKLLPTVCSLTIMILVCSYITMILCYIFSVLLECAIRGDE